MRLKRIYLSKLSKYFGITGTISNLYPSLSLKPVMKIY